MSGPTPAVGLDSPDLAAFAGEMARPSPSRSSLKIAFQPEDVQNGLAKLVLILIELIRELLERQALRRMEAGSLTDVEVERLGMTFLGLSEQMESLKKTFGLEGEDLNLDLGPLGKLLS
jgi:hypothetical protein